jgi:hypothetical protein
VEANWESLLREKESQLVGLQDQVRNLTGDLTQVKLEHEHALVEGIARARDQEDHHYHHQQQQQQDEEQDDRHELMRAHTELEATTAQLRATKEMLVQTKRLLAEKVEDHAASGMSMHACISSVWLKNEQSMNVSSS